ncbi:alpha/beta hydrolase [Actinosynnema sp. NPDC047251]|uniref:alpha/beta fold hydrolase n=1 Tax=Saccharothrix espanaensis TaxID=103731 RepID=UPI00031A8954|nr:alpha/beta hydrolase [Saccharothrix espanaensis]
MESTHSFGTSAYLDLGGRKLHHMSRGTGGPVVVFESGLGFSRSTWGLVQPVVARHVQAVVYDRAGTGRSDPDPRPRTLEHLADDLGALLDALGPGPFVLVGHSWGGAIVRVAAARRPDRVHGLVLVDQSDENADLYFTPAAAKRFALTARLTPALARSGLYKLLGGRLGRAQPADVLADHHAEDFGPAAARATVAELEPFVAELRALRENPPRLGDLPVTVVTGTRPTRLDRAVRQGMNDAHRRTAAALANGRLVEAARSAHLVLFDQPDLLVAEVLRLVRS